MDRLPGGPALDLALFLPPRDAWTTLRPLSRTWARVFGPLWWELSWTAPTAAAAFARRCAERPGGEEEREALLDLFGSVWKGLLRDEVPPELLPLTDVGLAVGFLRRDRADGLIGVRAWWQAHPWEGCWVHRAAAPTARFEPGLCEGLRALVRRSGAAQRVGADRVPDCLLLAAAVDGAEGLAAALRRVGADGNWAVLKAAFLLCHAEPEPVVAAVVEASADKVAAATFLLGAHAGFREMHGTVGGGPDRDSPASRAAMELLRAAAPGPERDAQLAHGCWALGLPAEAPVGESGDALNKRALLLQDGAGADLPAALEALLAAREALRGTRLEGRVLNDLGRLLRDMGRRDEAVETHRRALRWRRRFGDDVEASQSLVNLCAALDFEDCEEVRAATAAAYWARARHLPFAHPLHQNALFMFAQSRMAVSPLPPEVPEGLALRFVARQIMGTELYSLPLRPPM